MQTYDRMIDSGVTWLGKIPEAWPQRHARYLFGQTKRPVGKDASNYELLSLTLRGIIARSEVEGGKNPENYDTYQIVDENDLIMCLFDYDVTPRTVGRATRTGMVTGAYTVLKPMKDVSTRYYNYFFLSLDNTKELLHLCTGLRNGLSKPTFFGLNLPVPDYEVQKSIADFLDTETAKIDNLIVKQERMLELLEEKRLATITRAVTCSLNPNVELKETHNTWIPYVPKTWMAGTLRHHAVVETGGTPSRDNPNFWNNGTIPWMSSGEVNLRRVKSTKEFITELASSSTNAKVLPKGTVMMALNGQGKTKGMVAVLEIVAACNQSLVGIKCSEAVNSYFLYYYLLSRYKDIRSLVGDHRDGLNMEHVRSLTIPLPPIGEQERIVNYLEQHEQKTGILAKKIQTQISLLRERRTCLISHAVTGKIKV